MRVAQLRDEWRQQFATLQPAPTPTTPAARVGHCRTSLRYHSSVRVRHSHSNSCVHSN
jgi:hypothetical protein